MQNETSGGTPLTEEQVSAIQNALYRGRRIEAVKIYRAATGKDLREAKEYVDRVHSELKQKNPAMFVKRASDRNPLFWLIIAGALIVILYYFFQNR